MNEVRETSLEAYSEVKKNLGDRQLKVYNTISSLGCPTDLEVATYLRKPINTITPRRNELVKLGLVVECERRTCSISKRSAMTWRVKK